MSTKKTIIAPRVAPQHAAQAKPPVRSAPVITPIYWANHPDDPKDKPRTVAYWTLSMDGMYLTGIHTEALARKIAAVNDLLAALEQALRRLVHLGSDETGPCATMEAARAAISKATQP